MRPILPGSVVPRAKIRVTGLQIPATTSLRTVTALFSRSSIATSLAGSGIASRTTILGPSAVRRIAGTGEVLARRGRSVTSNERTRMMAGRLEM